MDTVSEKDIEEFILAPEAEVPEGSAAEQASSPEPISVEEIAPEVEQEAQMSESEDVEMVQELPATGETPLSARMDILEQKMDALNEAFAGKLRYDASKQVIIDRQYSELEALRHAEFAKLSNAIIMDVIDEIDAAEKSTRYFENQESTPENYEKMKKMLMGTAESLIDLLERNEVYSYRSEPGSSFNPKRQRVLRVVPTEDSSKDKTIQESLRAGFEREERVLRPELVAVYAFRH